MTFFINKSALFSKIIWSDIWNISDHIWNSLDQIYGIFSFVLLYSKSSITDSLIIDMSFFSLLLLMFLLVFICDFLFPQLKLAHSLFIASALVTFLWIWPNHFIWLSLIFLSINEDHLYLYLNLLILNLIFLYISTWPS